MIKKFSILIAGTVFALTNFQQALAETLTGTCGVSYEACHYTLDEKGKLTIKGNGAIGVNAFNNGFITFGGQIKDVVIEKGITETQQNAFFSLPNLESVSMPDTLTTIGRDSFYNLSKLKTVVIPKSVTSISGTAFVHTSLNDVTIEGKNVEIGGFDSLGYGLYKGNVNFKVVPGSQTEKRMHEIMDNLNNPYLAGIPSFEAYIPFQRRIYTVEEANNALGDQGRNTFSIQYR